LALRSINDSRKAKNLAAFARAVETAEPIIARSVEAVLAMVGSKELLLATHRDRVTSGAVYGCDTQLERDRRHADETIHPDFSHNIQHAALSLTGRGIRQFGDCFLRLNIDHIKDRTTIFEENSITFCNRHACLGREVPKGYRATWKRRQALCVAKLYDKITEGTTEEDFGHILANDNQDWTKSDFVEVHIYGRVHAKSIVEVIGRSKDARDLNYFLTISNVLAPLGGKVRFWE